MPERGRGGCANKKNAHNSIGLIGKFPTLILLGSDRPKKKHPDHPGETTGTAGGKLR